MWMLINLQTSICSGYMPPEYVEQGHFSIKSDIFSFGVLLLEIISGQLICNFSGEEKGESLPSFVSVAKL